MPIMTKSRNVDPAEIKNSKTWRRAGGITEGEFKPLHQINPLRLNYVLEKTEGLFGKERSSMLAAVAVFGWEHGCRGCGSYRPRYG